MNVSVQLKAEAQAAGLHVGARVQCKRSGEIGIIYAFGSAPVAGGPIMVFIETGLVKGKGIVREPAALEVIGLY